MNRRVLGLVLVAAFGVACRELPRDFAQRTLDDQVSLYAQQVRTTGVPLTYARSAIAAHGRAAADLMAEDLAAKTPRLPRYEAIQIIWSVARLGTDLRGTPADFALRSVLQRRDLDDLERRAAESALASIARHDSGGPR